MFARISYRRFSTNWSVPCVSLSMVNGGGKVYLCHNLVRVANFPEARIGNSADEVPCPRRHSTSLRVTGCQLPTQLYSYKTYHDAALREIVDGDAERVAHAACPLIQRTGTRTKDGAGNDVDHQVAKKIEGVDRVHERCKGLVQRRVNEEQR